MSVLRTSRLAALAVAGIGLAYACTHDDPATIVVRDGVSSIPVIDMSPAAAGFLGGSRAINRYLLTAFDTSIADAFARATTNPPYYRPEAGKACYGSSPMIYEPEPYVNSNTPIPTYVGPTEYLPAITGTAVVEDAGCGTATAYIVPSGHPGNGTGNTVWEFWHDFSGLGPTGTRYITGLARYALQQRGALDITEKLLTGAVTQPDSLVFMASDFNPGGKKSRDGFTTNCASVNVIHPIAGANPHYLASDTSRSGGIDLDQTVCVAAGEAWGALGTATSPIPKNDNTPLAVGGVQYNFFVIWQALADSTPDYSKPIYRVQVGPLVTTTGVVVNNAYAPIPYTGPLSAATQVLLPGGQGNADTIRVTANNLVPLTGATYQLWLAQSGTANAAKVTGRVVRLNGATVVDTLNGVSEFNLTTAITGARVEFDFAPLSANPWNAAVLAVGASGASTLPASQPLWTKIAPQKVPGGAVPTLSSNLTFGSFNAGTGTAIYGANGTGTGGLYGTELREAVLRLPRPPIGYMYQAWLINSASSAIFGIGSLIGPQRTNYTSLTDADIMTTDPLSGAEITESGFRYVAPAASFYCTYDRVQVRLAPKSGNPASLPPTVILSGSNPRVGC